MRFGEDITYCVMECEGCYRSAKEAGIGIPYADLSKDELCPGMGWERIWEAEDGTYKGRCASCGFTHLFIEGHDSQYKYCPSCGRKMKE